MFIEPNRIRQFETLREPNGKAICPCRPATHLVFATLVLRRLEDSAESVNSVLMCENVGLFYIYDMYYLQTGRKITKTVVEFEGKELTVEREEHFKVKNDARVVWTVPELLDLDVWLTVPFRPVKAFRYKSSGEESLELILDSPVRSGTYYVLGEKNLVLLNARNANENFVLHRETVLALVNKSGYCNLPYIRKVNVPKLRTC